MPDELRPHVRDEELPAESVVVVRGGPDNAGKLARHAARTNRAYVLDGQPLWGVSVFVALDAQGGASLDGLLSGRMRTYRVVHLPKVIELRTARFNLLPTFGRPHFTLVLPNGRSKTLEELVSALGAPQPNPYHEV